MLTSGRSEKKLGGGGVVEKSNFDQLSWYYFDDLVISLHDEVVAYQKYFLPLYYIVFY
jgi:hypothetical protein